MIITSRKTDDLIGEVVINFPVPKKRLSVMILALARIIEEEQRAVHAPQANSDADDVPWAGLEVEKEQIHIEWDEEKLRNLRKLLDNQAAIALLDMAASMPNERVYVADVMKKLECSHGKVGAGLGVLTKCITKMLNLSKVRFNWPAPFHWDKEEERAYYQMDFDAATYWKASATDPS